jgi:hypothetical protein
VPTMAIVPVAITTSWSVFERVDPATDPK